VSALLLEVAGLSVELAGTPKVRPVQDVSFHLFPGETLCIVGESGCGKSLTALALMGLLPRGMTRHAGRLRLLGEDLLAASEPRLSELRGDRMAMIFQDPMTALNPVLTVGEQLSEVWQRHRSAKRSGRRKAGRDRALELLELVGVPEAEIRLRQYPHQLSGGLRQRIGIAMALMCDPALLIADEPTTALDVTIQAQTLRVLADLRRRFGAAMVFVTHDLGVVARIADRVAVMYAGQIVETAPVGALFARPLHPYTQGLLGALAVPGRQRPRERLPTIPGAVPPPTDRVSACLFAGRCPRMAAACVAAPVALRDVAPGHAVRCVLA
jgi:peptide/nickel transport system ATP-binding protein